MKFRTLSYYLREAARNLIKNRLMSVASILTVASCILIVSVFYCLAANVDFFLGQLEESIQVSVFLRDDVSVEGVQELNSRIHAIPHVVNVVYVSPDEAFEDIKAGMGNPALFDGLSGKDVLPRSFDVEIDDIRNQPDVINALESLSADGVENIRHSQELADGVRVFSDLLRVVCVVLIIILGVISIVIIINTIRITVNARKTEINIMKYVGATDWFIRWPFVVEGVLIGFLGGLIPSVACWFLYGYAVGAIPELIPLISFVKFRPGYDIFMYLLPFDLLLGMFIGIIGSVFSVRKHLKV
ncbi:MAG: permease-like cell division protein FtsX [Clostridiales bacterium]|jgi:cell division transport system permease protein|nr:permease-like cell division protein FtsX [Clostridiales bacterium]